jgi:N-acetylneuraminic acid mutarotase
MMKLSELMAARCRRPRFFAIAIALGVTAAVTVSAEAGTGSAAAGAAITSPASYRVLSAAATQTPAGTWKKLPAAPITKAPVTMVSVWTGREMIIHGILPGGGLRGITFAYRPAARTSVQLADGPQPATTNSADVAVWTGSRMLVVGLTSGSYDPAANTWRKITRPGVSLGGAVTGWTGRQFLTWGGTCCEDTSRDGMAYNPATNTWRKLPAAPLQPRASASGAWTGKELIVAGGHDFFRKTVFRDAAAYNPSTGTWRKLPQMPRALTGGPALWDGKEILFLSSSSSARGLAYNPAQNRWRLLPAMPLPRFGFAAVRAGHRVLVWGGLAGSNPTWAPPAHGEAYNPAASQWTALPASPLHGRAFPSAVWTGHQMIVWGGNIPQATTDTFFTDGAAYTP